MHLTNGVLEVSPDFTNNRKPYTIELEHRKETLEVWIEHVSPGESSSRFQSYC